MATANQKIINAALDGRVIVDIGQVDASTKRFLNNMVKDGTLAKWRGYWHPVAGAPWGIGPLKSCWGLPKIAEAFAREAV
jgi:hypothetical protein